MLEAMKSLRDKMLSKKPPELDVVKTSDSAKAGPSNQRDPIPTQTSLSRTSDHSNVQPMDTDLYGPPLPSLLKMSSPSMLPSNRILNPTTLNTLPS